MITEQIESDLKDALRAKDHLAADTLRMLKARIMNEGIAQGLKAEGSTVSFADDKLQTIISSEIKRRKDAATAFEQGGRPELAEKEQQEAKILLKYMPEQLSEDDVRKVIDSALAGQTFAANDFGKAMALVMPQLKGKADGQLISKILKEKLS
jgi:hypothetical protein